MYFGNQFARRCAYRVGVNNNLTLLVLAFNTRRAAAKAYVGNVAQADELPVRRRHAQIFNVVNIGTLAFRQLQNNIVVVIADCKAVAGAFAHKGHFHNFTDGIRIEPQKAGARLVKPD